MANSSSEISGELDAVELRPVAPSRRSGTFDLRTAPHGLDDDPTLVDRHPFGETSAPQLGDRYEGRAVLGEGGMGEVRLVWDRTVGREVAMKVLLARYADRPYARARFLREAHVQAYLDHPGIVPVYDVGTLPSGEPYFTMRRVRGLTLREVLTGLRRKEPPIANRFGRRRLLAGFARACLVVDFAHARGVVHRDLKPENLMFGDDGEVYVLDWDFARIASAPMHRVPQTLWAPFESEGEVPGTPGYMAPEQLISSHLVEPAADVYALGAILFELLTLEPMHPGLSAEERIASTRRGADARCSVRAPEAKVPPELEALCVRTTAADPSRRPTAREIHEAIESYLEGVRESERCRLVSELHLRAAKENWKEAATGGPNALSAQLLTIRSLGRAIATDPRNQEALSFLLRLLDRPMEGALPGEVEAALRAEEEHQRRVAFRNQRWGRLSAFLYVPMLLWLGVRDLGLLALAIGATAVSAVLGWAVDRFGVPGSTAKAVVAVTAILTLMPLATIFSSIVLVPLVVATVLPGFLMHLERRGRRAALVAACTAVLLPLGLESVGWIPPTLVFRNGAIEIVPQMVSFPELPTRIALAIILVAPILTAAFISERIRAERDSARRRMHLMLWRLRQVMPALRIDEEGRDA